MLWAWDVVGRQSVVEPWCIMIGRGESPVSEAKESLPNAWQAIFSCPLFNGDRLKFNTAHRLVSCLRFSVSCLFCPISHVALLALCLLYLFPYLPLVWLVMDTLSCLLPFVLSSLAFCSSALSFSSCVLVFFHFMYRLLAFSSFTRAHSSILLPWVPWEYSGRKLW